MNFKSLLLSSAAALATMTSAQAADAVVAAEPEAVDYVRVCDKYGTGYFYIPGTETCLGMSGSVRSQINYSEDSYGIDGKGDLDAKAKAYLTVESYSETDYGTLLGTIDIIAPDKDSLSLDDAWINIAGFDIGYFYGFWGDDPLGDVDTTSDRTSQNGIRYVYEANNWTAGASIEELIDTNTSSDDDIGVTGKIGYSVEDGISVWGLASYDFDADQSAFKGMISTDIGKGTWELSAVYAENPNYYWSTSKWSFTTDYKFNVTDKLFILPGFQYYGDYEFKSGKNAYYGSLQVGYQITDGLKTLADVAYLDPDGPGNHELSGFLRLQRSF